jgi:hypothetical protein
MALLIRLAGSPRWSETEAPAVLAWYSAYVLLLAVNGGRGCGQSRDTCSRDAPLLADAAVHACAIAHV